MFSAIRKIFRRRGELKTKNILVSIGIVTTPDNRSDLPRSLSRFYEQNHPIMLQEISLTPTDDSDKWDAFFPLKIPEDQSSDQWIRMIGLHLQEDGFEV